MKDILKELGKGLYTALLTGGGACIFARGVQAYLKWYNNEE